MAWTGNKSIVLNLVLLATLILISAGIWPFSFHHRIAKKVVARLEMSALATAIEAYANVYGHMPVSFDLQKAITSGDLTYGTLIDAPASPVPIGTKVRGEIILNSEIISILMNFTNFPGDPQHATVNTNFSLNPQQIKFLNPRMVSDATQPGVGPDLVYRDPWGTPYFITVDLNGDGFCDDVFYSKATVSQRNGGERNGFDGLSNDVDAGGKGNHFQWRGRVMIWSAGPDRKVNPVLPADEGENKDNVVSWQ